jgi:hypothetical protein
MRKTSWPVLGCLISLVAGCAVSPAFVSSPAVGMAPSTALGALRAVAPAWPDLTGARPTVLPQARALAQRIKPDEPKTPYELWETKLANRWATPVKLFPDLPSAYDAQLLQTGATTRLYFAAIPPRSYTPRIHQTTAAGNGAWQEPEKLDLLDQGKGAESPDVVTDSAGRWWMAYASAGRQTDVRLARSANGAQWEYVDKLDDGATRPKLAALPDGRLAVAYELNGEVVVKLSADGATWQESLRIPASREAAISSAGNRLLLATLPTARRRGGGLTWRQTSDGRQWSAPKTLTASPSLGSLRWLTEGSQVALYGAAADGLSSASRIPVSL